RVRAVRTTTCRGATIGPILGASCLRLPLSRLHGHLRRYSDNGRCQAPARRLELRAGGKSTSSRTAALLTAAAGLHSEKRRTAFTRADRAKAGSRSEPIWCVNLLYPLDVEKLPNLSVRAGLTRCRVASP